MSWRRNICQSIVSYILQSLLETIVRKYEWLIWNCDMWLCKIWESALGVIQPSYELCQSKYAHIALIGYVLLSIFFLYIIDIFRERAYYRFSDRFISSTSSTSTGKEKDPPNHAGLECTRYQKFLTKIFAKQTKRNSFKEPILMLKYIVINRKYVTILIVIN